VTKSHAKEGEAIEDRNVHKIANQIEEITRETPTVVTHHDRDRCRKIARFRRGIDPYLVAINMVSEGCDIPPPSSSRICRYTNSEMLFRQIRRTRPSTPSSRGWHGGTDLHPSVSATRPIRRDALQRGSGRRSPDRRCKECDGWPCECPCPECGQHPCECEQLLFPTNELKLVGIDADAANSTVVTWARTKSPNITSIRDHDHPRE